MPEVKDNLKTLHTNLVKEGFDLPDYETFSVDMSDESKLTKFHDNLVKEGFDIPALDVFVSDMGLKKKGQTELSPFILAPSEQPSPEPLNPLDPRSVSPSPSASVSEEKPFEYKFDEQVAIEEPKTVTTGTGWETIEQKPKGKEESSTAGDLYNSLLAGSDRLGSSIARTPSFVYDLFAIPQNLVAKYTGIPIGTSAAEFGKTIGIPENEVAQYYEKALDETKAKINEKYDKGVSDYFSNGDYSKGFGLLANQIVESAPMSISLALGNYAGLTPIQSILGGGAVFAADKKAELEKSGAPLDEIQQVSNAVSSGILEGIFEQFGITKLGGMVKDALVKEGKEKAVELAKTGFKESYLPVFKKYFGVAAEEALGEAATQFSQNAVDKESGYKPDLNLMDGVVDAALVGLGSGSAFSAAPATIEVFKTSQARKEANGILEQQKSLEGDIQNPEVSPDTKSKLADLSQKLNEKLADIRKEDKAIFENLSEENKQKAQEIVSKINSNQQALSDPNISQESKKVFEEQQKALEKDLSDFEASIASEANKDFSFDNINTVEGKRINAEYINENDLKQSEDELYSLADKIEKDNNIPDDVKQRMLDVVEQEIEKTQNYEFRTKTETVTTSKRRTTKGASTVVKERPVFQGGRKKLIGREVTTDTGIEGGREVLEESNGGLYIVGFDGTGKRIDSKRLDAKSIYDLNIENVNFDSDGNVESVGLSDKSGVKITIDSNLKEALDPKNQDKKAAYNYEVALDLAIEKQQQELGTIPEVDLQEAIEEVTGTKEVPYIFSPAKPNAGTKAGANKNNNESESKSSKSSTKEGGEKISQSGSEEKGLLKPNEGTGDDIPPSSNLVKNVNYMGLDDESIKKTAGKLKQWLKDNFKVGGLLPKNVFKEKIQFESGINATLRDIGYTSRDLKKAIKKDFPEKLTPEQIATMDAALKGDKAKLSELPKNVQNVIQDMRNQIDALSIKMIEEGVIDGDLVSKIDENIGAYVTRSYKLHDNPEGWNEFINKNPEGQLIRNRAVAFIRNEYKKRGENISDSEIDGIINELLFTPEAPLGLLSKGKLGSKDLGILVKRKDIAPEIRALMGEYGDPLLNYAKSITKMASLIGKQKFLNKVRQEGMGTFLFEKPNKDNYVQIAAEGSKTMSPLNGLYTTPEIKYAFENFDPAPVTNEYLRAYLKLNGFVKYSKTVLSVMTHTRNVVGNMFFMLSNAHLRLGKFKEASKVILSDLGVMDKKEFRERYKRYLELGVVYDNPNTGDLQAIIKDVTGKKDPFETLIDNKIIKFKDKALDAVSNLYQAEDDIFKIYAFENEVSRYKKAYPNKDISEIEKIAAENIRNTYPTYSLVPKIVKEFRKNPFVGTFVSFPAEVIRTSWNTVALAKKELSNKETRGIGAQRLSGLLTAATLTTAASLATRAMVGVSDDEEDDIREFLPTWSKNSQFIFLGKKDGKIKYIDLGYSDPHSYIKDPIKTLFIADDTKEAMVNSIKELLSPFISEQILAKRIREIASNKKESGKEVYNEQLPLGDQAAAIYEHLAAAIEPGTVRSLRRMTEGSKGITGDQGKKYGLRDEIIAMFSGQRIEELDAKQALSFKINRVKKDVDEAKDIYNSVKYRAGEIPKEELDKALENSQTALSGIYEKAKEYHDAAIRLGVDTKDIDEIFKRNKLSKETIKNIKEGEADFSEEYKLNQIFEERLHPQRKTLEERKESLLNRREKEADIKQRAEDLGIKYIPPRRR